MECVDPEVLGQLVKSKLVKCSFFDELTVHRRKKIDSTSLTNRTFDHFDFWQVEVFIVFWHVGF